MTARLDYYSTAESAGSHALREPIGVPITRRARASSPPVGGTPRVGTLLTPRADFAETRRQGKITGKWARDALKLLEADERADDMDRRMLEGHV